MDKFNNNEYAVLMGNLLHDTRYIETSNMGKMSGLRKQAEVIVRKILNIGNNKPLTIGEIRKKSKNVDVNDGIEDLGDELSGRLINIVNKIKSYGNAGTHTQHTEDFSDEEVKNVEDAILDLYALIFIQFFMDIDISIYTNPEILSEFSILPPVIRFKTWNYLFERDKSNIQVADKLCLSIIKQFDKKTAYEWLEENREIIEAIPYPTKKEIEKYDQMHVVEIAPGRYVAKVSLNFAGYHNMYDLLYEKIKDPRTSMNESGKMYKTFEEAVEHYTNYQKNTNQTDSEEMAKFHSLMEFVYLGVKPQKDLYS